MNSRRKNTLHGSQARRKGTVELMREEDIERFVDQFEADGFMRRRRNRRGRGQPPGQGARDDRRAARQRDMQRRAARDAAHEGRIPVDEELVDDAPEAVPEEAPEVTQAQKEARLADLRTEVARLEDVQIKVRHKGPAGASNTQALIDAWLALDTTANAADANDDSSLDGLDAAVSAFKTALAAMEDMFDADAEAPDLYFYAVSERKLDPWPELVAAAAAMNNAIVWPQPAKAAYVGAAEAIRKGKAKYEEISGLLQGLDADWQQARAIVAAVKAKLNSDFLRLRETPAVDQIVERLTRIFGGTLTVADLADGFIANIRHDLAAIETWAATVDAKVEGTYFTYLELSCSAMQSKHDTKPWDFETQRETLTDLLCKKLDVTGGELQKGFDDLLARHGPWSGMLKVQEARAKMQQSQQRLADFFENTWGMAKGNAERFAESCMRANEKAETAFTRFALTKADYEKIRDNHMRTDDAAIALLLSLPGGSDTVRIARCMRLAYKVRMSDVVEADLEGCIANGDATLKHERHFEYRPGRIEEELGIHWSFDGMPRGKSFAVVHIHYGGSTITNNSNDVTFAHAKDWTARQAGGSSECKVENALLTRCLGLVPHGTSL